METANTSNAEEIDKNPNQQNQIKNGANVQLGVIEARRQSTTTSAENRGEGAARVSIEGANYNLTRPVTNTDANLDEILDDEDNDDEKNNIIAEKNENNDNMSPSSDNNNNDENELITDNFMIEQKGNGELFTQMLGDANLGENLMMDDIIENIENKTAGND